MRAGDIREESRAWKARRGSRHPIPSPFPWSLIGIFLRDGEEELETGEVFSRSPSRRMSPSAGMPQDLLVLEEKSPPPCFHSILRARLYAAKQKAGKTRVPAGRQVCCLHDKWRRDESRSTTVFVNCMCVHVCTGTLAEAGIHTCMLTCMNVQKVRTLCEQVVFHLSWDRVPHWDLKLAKKGGLAD